MGKVGQIMTIGKQSMMNSQTALQTVSHNIANKSTEGYSRQRVELQSNEPTGFGKNRMGQGAHVSQIRRTNNEFLEKQIGDEMSKEGFYRGQAEPLNRIEQVFNEQDNKGLNQFVSGFFNAFREFSNNPESLASRTLVKETAAQASKDFGRVSRQIKAVQSEIDQFLNIQTTQVNAITEEIASLNQKVQNIEVSGGVANDERDRRDLLIKQLGDKLNIRVGQGDDGMVNITAGNTALLVSGVESAQLKAAASGAREGKRDGNFDIYFISSSYSDPIRVTEQFTGGQLGGALVVRDKIANSYLQKIDKMAYTLTNEVNEAHRLGFNKYGLTEQDFFQTLETEDDAAAKIDLDRNIFNDVNNIAAGIAPDSPGDNRVAIVISGLQGKPLMDDGQTTMDDFYNGAVGELAVQTHKMNNLSENQKDIVAQLKNIRESISGVSLDEETIKMIEFQKAFDASAKMIKTADEMMQTILNLKS